MSHCTVGLLYTHKYRKEFQIRLKNSLLIVHLFISITWKPSLDTFCICVTSSSLWFKTNQLHLQLYWTFKILPSFSLLLKSALSGINPTSGCLLKLLPSLGGSGGRSFERWICEISVLQSSCVAAPLTSRGPSHDSLLWLRLDSGRGNFLMNKSRRYFDF